MRRQFFYTLLCAVFVGAETASALTDSWGVDVRQHTAVQRTYKQGESIDMQISLRNGLKPLDLTGATAVWYWYTNATANVWWTNAAAIPTPRAGLITAPWTPAMDTGADLYAYWIGVWMPGATSPLWRVTGTIRMLPSPGFAPNAIPLPVRTLDFDSIAITNAPWQTSTDLQALSNTLASALQDGLTNTVPAQIASAVAPLATTQHVADAVAPLITYDHTNRVTRLHSADGQQWMDSTGVLWRVSYGLTTVIDTNRLVVSAVDAPANESPPELGATFVVSTPGTWTCGVWAVQYDTVNLRLRVFNAAGRWATPREPVYPAGPEGKWRAFEVDEDAYFSIYYATDRILSVSTSVVDRVSLASESPVLAFQNVLLYTSAGTNYYWRFDADQGTYVITGVPQ